MVVFGEEIAGQRSGNTKFSANVLLASERPHRTLD